MFLNAKVHKKYGEMPSVTAVLLDQLHCCPARTKSVAVENGGFTHASGADTWWCSTYRKPLLTPYEIESAIFLNVRIHNKYR